MSTTTTEGTTTTEAPTSGSGSAWFEEVRELARRKDAVLDKAAVVFDRLRELDELGQPGALRPGDPPGQQGPAVPPGHSWEAGRYAQVIDLDARSWCAIFASVCGAG